MHDRKLARKRAIMRRNIFFGVCALVLILLFALIIFVIKSIFSNDKTDGSSAVVSSSVNESSQMNVSSQTSQDSVSSVADVDNKNEHALDANYTNLLLVNGENPLPEDYDYEGNLVSVEQKYINGSLKQINKDIESYILAMIEAAWDDGVKLYIWSPYRSYSTQNMLYENQVKKCMDKGLSREAAEVEAATVVARPGTSEHHTGLACDFNMANDNFETTAMYRWMTENAENYGFIMRYSKEKQEKTGVIHESWHWRFVGINAAKEINKLGMCLEEYVEFKNKQG